MTTGGKPLEMHENIVGIDAAILMHPTTWKASEHVDAFNDPLLTIKIQKSATEHVLLKILRKISVKKKNSERYHKSKKAFWRCIR